MSLQLKKFGSKPVARGNTGPIDTSDPVADPSDLGGWNVYTPIPFDLTVYALTHKLQPGTRIRFMSQNDGDDGSGADDYFWDGVNSRLVDSSGSHTGTGGVPYGNDPFDPSGPIKPYRTLKYCGVGMFGGDIGEGDTVGRQTFTNDNGAGVTFYVNNRLRKPDWWLFKRGETIDLTDDYGSAGNSALSIPGGLDEDSLQILGAYGSLSDPRPKFIHPDGGFFHRYAGQLEFQHARILSLHFDGRDRTVGQVFTAIQQIGHDDVPNNAAFEDIWIDGCDGGANLQTSGGHPFIRCIITDCFKPEDTGHVQGIFGAGYSEEFFVSAIDCFLMRNGFTSGDPSIHWPPDGINIDWDIFSKNIYITKTGNHAKGLFKNNAIIAGATGSQFRHGASIEENFFYDGFVQLQGGGGDSQPNSGSFKRNVVQLLKATAGDVRAHPAQGLQVGHGLHDVEIEDNIITRAQCGRLENSSSFCFSLFAILQDLGTPLLNATQYNKVRRNIFDCGDYSSAIQIVDGTGYDASYDYVPPGFIGNEITLNVAIYNGTQGQFVENNSLSGGAPGDGLNDTEIPFTGSNANSIYSNIDVAIAAKGYYYVNRTLKSYLQAIGEIVTSDDGVPEYVAIVKTMRKGYYRKDMMAQRIVNYIRAGWNMSAVSV